MSIKNGQKDVSHPSGKTHLLLCSEVATRDFMGNWLFAYRNSPRIRKLSLHRDKILSCAFSYQKQLVLVPSFLEECLRAVSIYFLRAQKGTQHHVACNSSYPTVSPSQKADKKPHIFRPSRTPQQYRDRLPINIFLYTGR